MGALRNVVPNLVEMPDRRAFDVQQAVRRTSLRNASAKSVLQVLAAAVNAKGWCFLSTQSVVAESDVDLRTLQKIKQVFTQIGLLTHVRLTRTEIAELRQRGGVGAYREEEWQLNLEMLGQDLSREYALLLSKVNGKDERQAGVRGKAKPGPQCAAAADAANTPDCAAAAGNSAAAASPSYSLLGKNYKEHYGTPSHTRDALDRVDTNTLSETTALVCSTLGWCGPWAVRTIYPACSESLGSLCTELQIPLAVASDLLISAWQLEQTTDDPAKSVSFWFGSGRWLRQVNRVRATSTKGAQVTRRRRVELDDFNTCRVRVGLKPMTAEAYADCPEHSWMWVDESATDGVPDPRVLS